MSKIKILKCPGLHSLKVEPVMDEGFVLTGFYKILLDGQELHGVTGINLKLGIDELSSVKLTMNVNVEDIQTLADLEIEFTDADEKKEEVENGTTSSWC